MESAGCRKKHSSNDLHVRPKQIRWIKPLVASFHQGLAWDVVCEHHRFCSKPLHSPSLRSVLYRRSARITDPINGCPRLHQRFSPPCGPIGRPQRRISEVDIRVRVDKTAISEASFSQARNQVIDGQARLRCHFVDDRAKVWRHKPRLQDSFTRLSRRAVIHPVPVDRRKGIVLERASSHASCASVESNWN